jgi:hypothetical protein
MAAGAAPLEESCWDGADAQLANTALAINELSHRAELRGDRLPKVAIGITNNFLPASMANP